MPFPSPRCAAKTEKLSLTTGFLFDDRSSYPGYGFMRRPLRSISIRPCLEVSFEDRLQDELQSPLDHSITDCRNRKDADFLAPILWNLLLPCLHGPIRVGN